MGYISLLPTGKLGKSFASMGIPKTTQAMMVGHATCDVQANALRATSWNDFAKSLAQDGINIADQQSGGIAGAVWGFVKSASDQVQLHKDTIETMQNKVPGMVTYDYEYRGKQYTVYVDATGTVDPDKSPVTYNDADLDKKKSANPKKKGLDHRVPKHIRDAAENAAEAKAREEVDAYLEKHGPDAYERLLEKQADIDSIKNEYERDNKIDLDKEPEIAKNAADHAIGIKNIATMFVR